MGHWETKRDGIEQTIALLMRPEGAHIDDIASRLQCHRSTAYRYLNEVKAEYEVEELGEGRLGINPKHLLGRVRFTPHEALLVYVALRRTLLQVNAAPRALLDALYKMLPTLQQTLLVNNLHDTLKQTAAVRLATPEQEMVWDALLTGWSKEQLVEIDYLKAGANTSERHICEPILLEPLPFGDSIYLIAWSHQRNNVRTFKVERIQFACVLLERFKPRKVPVNTLLLQAWGVWYGAETTRVVLRFAPGKAARVMESRYHLTEQKAVQPDGTVLWSVMVAAPFEMAHWILGWGAGVEVLEPLALRQYIADELASAAALY